MNNKERYIDFCKTEEDIPVFSQPWWMDVMVGPDNWDVYLVGEQKDIKASFVYYYTVEKEVKSVKRALLTQTNGVYIKYPPNQGIISRQKYEEKILDEILNYIESLNLNEYQQQFSWRLKNCLPFFWRYYTCTVKYTYVIYDTSNMDIVRANYSSNARKNIKKAKKNICIKETSDVDLFYKIHAKTFERQEIPVPITYEHFKEFVSMCKKNNAAKLMCAYDANDKAISVAMIVYDQKYVYFLLNGSDPSYNELQGNYLLIDACIEEAHNMGKGFDFEGSVIRRVNHAYREFGGEPTPYFSIKKSFE